MGKDAFPFHCPSCQTLHEHHVRDDRQPKDGGLSQHRVHFKSKAAQDEVLSKWIASKDTLESLGCLAAAALTNPADSKVMLTTAWPSAEAAYKVAYEPKAMEMRD